MGLLAPLHVHMIREVRLVDACLGIGSEGVGYQVAERGVDDEDG
jgi:hypothetical protein